MKYITGAEWMKKIDEYTIHKTGIPDAVLMERAALSVVYEIEKRTKGYERVLIVCGTGNNGADGMCCSRILQERGYEVDVVILGNHDRFSQLAELHRNILGNLGIEINSNVEVKEYDIIVDAIFGIGLSKNIEGTFAKNISMINKIRDKYGAKVFSVDIPSGISTDTGKVLGIAVEADYTVTFGLLKKGMVFEPGRHYAGEIIVAHIGFTKEVYENNDEIYFTYEMNDLKEILPKRKMDSNKGSYGKVLIVAGSKNMAGAAVLSANAAIRSGAGLVKVLTCESNRNIIQTSVPEALISTYEENDDLERLVKSEILWADVVIAGPGISMNDTARRIVNIICENITTKLILDADALNILADENKTIPKGTIITPHLKEMSRLINKTVSEIKDSKVDIAKDYANTNEIVVVLKDSKTVASNGKKVYINSSGNNGMATGGSGDVLTGIIGAYLAQSDNVFECCCAGVFVHGLAADIFADEYNVYSLTPTDIIDNLKRVLQNVD